MGKLYTSVIAARVASALFLTPLKLPKGIPAALKAVISVSSEPLMDSSFPFIIMGSCSPTKNKNPQTGVFSSVLGRSPSSGYFEPNGMKDFVREKPAKPHSFPERELGQIPHPADPSCGSMAGGAGKTLTDDSQPTSYISSKDNGLSVQIPRYSRYAAPIKYPCALSCLSLQAQNPSSM